MNSSSARFYTKIGGIRSRTQEEQREQRKMSEIHRNEQGKCTISTEALALVNDVEEKRRQNDKETPG